MNVRGMDNDALEAALLELVRQEREVTERIASLLAGKPPEDAPQETSKAARSLPPRE